MTRAYWKIYRVKVEVLDDPAVPISTAEEFSELSGIGLPEVQKMLPNFSNGLYKTRTKKKVERAVGTHVATRVCFKAAF